MQTVMELLEARSHHRVAVHRESFEQRAAAPEDAADEKQVFDASPSPSQEITIVYRDAAGAESTRTIRIDGVTGSDPEAYISAFCYLRRKRRTFVLGRILEAFDADGVVIPDIGQFVRGAFAPAVDTGVTEQWRQTVHRVSAESLLLKLLVSADGKISEGELEAVEGELMAAYAHGPDITRNEHRAMKGVIRRTTATPESLALALQTISRMPQEEIMRFLRSCGHIMAIDGHVHEAEKAMLRSFGAALGVAA
jgi:uncharacterized tellurite resistance protein B-like protein